MPMVVFDYAGIKNNGEFVSPVELKGMEDDESIARVLVVALRTPDDRQSCVFGHTVPCKGVDRDKFSVDCLVSDIVWTGYTRVLLKLDNEPAILKLLIESLKELRVNGLEQVMSENAPEYDPRVMAWLKRRSKVGRACFVPIGRRWKRSSKPRFP